MEAIIYVLFFMGGGLLISRYWLPRLRPLVRWFVGASTGLALMLWLPVLWAYVLAYTLTAHLLAALTLCLLAMLAFQTRDRHRRVRFGQEDRRTLRVVLLVAVPLTLLAGWLQYTHSIRPAPDGTYHVGQSTYGDLSLHLAVATSIVDAKFPLQNSLMVGATMAYPYLADSFAASLYMLEMSLPAAMAVSGTLMCAFVFVGYTLLCAQLCRRRGAVWLAALLLFFNGGLGFFYTLGGTVENGVTTTVWDNLNTVMQGYYKTPTNQPDPNNLRWVNILCDMLIPQRGLLGGWTMLMPVLLLILPPLALRRRHAPRALILAGLMAGGMPLLHTHSFLALALASAGILGYCLFTAPAGYRWEAFKPFLLYGGIAAALSLPQLVNLTFVQATASDHFLRFRFNWCNNRGGNGLVDPYFWFYIKNIGLPYLLILLGLFERRKGELRDEADRAAAQTVGLYVPEPDFAATPAATEEAAQTATEPAAQTIMEAAAQAAPEPTAQSATDSAAMPPAAMAAQPAAATATQPPTADNGEDDDYERTSLYAHEMPSYGQSLLPKMEDIAPFTPQMPYVRPLPPEKLRAAAFSPEDNDRVGVMRAVTGTEKEEAGKRPLIEEIYHATYGRDRDAEQAERERVLMEGQPETCFADTPPARDWVRQRWMLAAGAFLILLVAELFLFQPNEYDNNKLIYVWFMLCLPMAADYALELFSRLKGLGGRNAIAALFLAACFLSAGLTVARETVSDYQAYSVGDIAVGDFVRDNTPAHTVFLTGSQHLNPVASLAGRTIVCGSDLYLYYHGFTTTGRRQEVQAFYEAPADHLKLLDKYGVSYIYVSPSERQSYNVDADTLRMLFPVVYESSDGAYLVLSVPAAYRTVNSSTGAAATPSPTPTPDPAQNPSSPG